MIEQCLKKILRELIPFITIALENWKRKSNQKRIEPNRSQIRRSIFQGDLLFLLKMAELYFNQIQSRLLIHLISRKAELPHILDDLKSFAEKSSYKRSESSASMQEWNLALRHVKCFDNKQEKKQKKERKYKRNCPTQETIRMHSKQHGYKFLGILESDTIKQTKEKVKKEYIKRTKTLLETKIYDRNLIKIIKT